MIVNILIRTSVCRLFLHDFGITQGVTWKNMSAFCFERGELQKLSKC
jgi:hypothetical protein